MHSKIVEILEKLNIDIGWQEYKEKAKEYIVFNIYNDEESSFYDNENLSETYYITINYWYVSKSNINKWKEIRKLMKENNFIYDGGKDLKEGNLYGKSMDYIYQEII